MVASRGSRSATEPGSTCAGVESKTTSATDRVRSMVVSAHRSVSAARTRCIAPSLSATMNASASIPSSTNMARPVSRPSSTAMPALSRRPICSVRPTPSTASPEAIRGSHASRCSALPACVNATGAITQVATNGTGAAAPPNDSAISAASSMLKPTPPWLSGVTMPCTPSRARPSHTSAGFVSLASAASRTRGRAQADPRYPETLSWSMRCSSVRPNSIYDWPSGIFGSLGSPRARSPIRFFWICAVPPPMMRPRSSM